MPVEFSCDGCNRRLRAPDAKAGKRTTCPTCGKDLLIPVMNVTPQISIPSANVPHSNPLDKLTGFIPAASEASAGFQLAKPGAANPAMPHHPSAPGAKPVSSQPGPSQPKSYPPNSFPSKSPQPVEIGLADDAPPTGTSASSLSNSGSNSNSGIGGSLKPKPNAWRGGQKSPALPGAPTRPAQPQPAAPNLVIPAAGNPELLSLPMASAASLPLVPVATNPLDDIFKDIPQLAPVNSPFVGAAQPYSHNASVFGGLKPVTAADPFQAQGATLPSAAPNWSQVASSANMGSGNPYAAPTMGASAGYRRRADIESVRTMVMIPGVLLLICYIFTFLGTIARLVLIAVGLVVISNNPQMQRDAGGSLGISFEIIVNVSLFLLSLGGLFGAIKMVRMRSWSAALTASIMAIFPFCLCLPIGIWSVIVLSMGDVRSAFEANDRRAERGM